MKVLAILLVSFIGIVLGSVSSGIYSSPEHPEKCVIGGKVYEAGTHNNPSETECYRIECSKSGFVEFADCGVQSFSSNCKDEGFKDVSKPYPECCERKVTCTN